MNIIAEYENKIARIHMLSIDIFRAILKDKPHDVLLKEREKLMSTIKKFIVVSKLDRGLTGYFVETILYKEDDISQEPFKVISSPLYPVIRSMV